jgi:multiple sugar transport system ATP-binding protein
MVFQNYSLYPHMTVFENMAFGLRNRHVPKAEVKERVTRVAGVLGLEDLLKRKPKALSGGQRQRVAIGRAIVRQPQAFLLDEPLSDLDTRLRAQMRQEIVSLQRAFETTTLYVTHDQAEALVLGDRVAVMRAGTFEQVDVPRRLYERPANLFVAGFIGSPPMNLAEATVEEQDGALYLRFGGHRLLIDERTLAERPAVRGYEWKQVVLGVRPEDLRSAEGGVPDDLRLGVRVRQRETAGADVYLHFLVDAPLLLEEDPRDPELGEAEGEPWPVERLNVFQARVEEGTIIVEGDRVELTVRPGRLHLFDPKTGESILD